MSDFLKNIRGNKDLEADLESEKVEKLIAVASRPDVGWGKRRAIEAQLRNIGYPLDEDTIDRFDITD